MKIIYESFDGKHFEDKDKCVQYEQTYFKSRVDEFYNIIRQIMEYCDSIDSCKDCPFYKENFCGFRKFTDSCPWEW